MEARTLETGGSLLNTKEQIIFSDILGRLGSSNISLVKNGLIDCSAFLNTIAARLDNQASAQADDLYTLLLKHQLLTDTELKVLIGSLKPLCDLKDPSSAKGIESIRSVMNYYNNFKQSELSTDNKKAINAFPLSKKLKLLAIISELRTPKNICIKIEKRLFKSIISSPTSFSVKQLTICDKLIKIYESNIHNVDLRPNSAQFIMLRYLALDDAERKKLLEIIKVILDVKSPTSRDGMRIVKKQIKDYHACLKTYVPTKEIKSIASDRLQLTKSQCQKLSSILVKLCNSESLSLIKQLSIACKNLFAEVLALDDVDTLNHVFNPLMSYVSFIAELIAYAKYQHASLAEIPIDTIIVAKNDLIELSKRIEEKIVDLIKVERPRLEFAKPYKALDLDNESALERMKELKISSIGTLLKSDLYLHIIEIQQGLIKEDEAKRYTSHYFTENIKTHPTQQQLLDSVAPFLEWRKANAHLLAGLAITMDLLETISTLLLALKITKELSDHPALADRATRIKEILPTHNKHMHNIRDILIGVESLQKRFTEFVENTFTDKAQPTVPTLALTSLPSTASEVSVKRNRSKSHVRRIEYGDKRGISLAALPTLFTPLSARTESSSSSRNTHSARKVTETNESDIARQLNPL